MREVVAFAQKWGTQHRLANAYWVAAQAYAAAGDRAEAAACVESAVRSGRPDVVGAHFLRAAIALGEETRIWRLARRQPHTNGQAGAGSP